MSFTKYKLLQVKTSASHGVKTDPAVTFGSEVFKSIDIHKFDDQFHVGYNQIVLQINEFQRSDSD